MMFKPEYACACCQPTPTVKAKSSGKSSHPASYRGIPTPTVKDSLDGDRPAGIPSYLKPVRLNGPDAEDVLKSFLRINEKKVYRPLLNLWEAQRAAWTVEAVKNAMLTGSLPADIDKQWTEEYAEIVAEVIGPVMLDGALRGARYMDESMTAALPGKSRKEVNEDVVGAAVGVRGTQMAVDFSRGAEAAAGVSLRMLIDANMSETDIRFIMRGIVGLGQNDAANAIKSYNASIAAKTPKATARNQFLQYTRRARDARSQNISRSELAAAFNGGAYGQVNAAIDSGVLIGDRVVKQFLTVGDERVCIICEPLDGKIVGFESPLLADPTTRYFSYQQPPLHWGCRCVIIYATYL